MQDDSLPPSGSTHGAEFPDHVVGGSAERGEGAAPKTAEEELLHARQKQLEAMRRHYLKTKTLRTYDILYFY
jgi:hypothetical protein